MAVPFTQDLLGAWEDALDAAPHERSVRMLAPLLADAPGWEETLSVGDRDRLLLELRERAFGSRVEGLTPCPGCGEPLELDFDLEAIRVPRPRRTPHGPESGTAGGDREDPDDPTLAVERDGYRVRFRPLLHQDLAAVAEHTDEAAARRLLLRRCVVDASRAGRPVDAEGLPGPVEAAVVAALREADPQSDIRLELDCPACHTHWAAPFDIGAFLWVELDAWSRRTLDTVHRLARAYGWPESEILALSPARRRHYLGLIGP